MIGDKVSVDTLDHGIVIGTVTGIYPSFPAPVYVEFVGLPKSSAHPSGTYRGPFRQDQLTVVKQAFSSSTQSRFSAIVDEIAEPTGDTRDLKG
jgi:hypothetical protein